MRVKVLNRWPTTVISIAMLALACLFLAHGSVLSHQGVTHDHIVGNGAKWSGTMGGGLHPLWDKYPNAGSIAYTPGDAWAIVDGKKVSSGWIESQE